MTVIDSLVVLLGLDSKDLESKSPGAVKSLDKLEKQGEKTEKSVGKISKSSKDAAKSVEGLTKVVGSLLAVIGGTAVIKAFIRDFIETNAQLDRLSKNLGLSVSTISAWSNATERLGGSAQGLQGTFDMLSKSQTQLMLTGESSLIPYMSALGISLADVNGKARPVTEVLLDLSERFSRMDRTTANNMGRMMGIDQGTMNLLLQGRKELELQIARQKEHNAVTKAQAEAAQKLQTRIADLKQGFSAFGRDLLMQALPTLEKILTWMQSLGDWVRENKEFIVDFLKVMAVGLGAIALASMPINLTVAAVLALGTAIALLWQDYQTWKRGGDSFIDWGKWEPGITAATKAIQALGSAAEHTWGFLKSILEYGSGGKDEGHLGTTYDKAHGRNSAKGGAHAPTAAASASIPKISDRLDPKTIKQFFMSQGWSDAQAAGITSNIISESYGKADATGDKGTAFGLAQWHPDRQADFARWAGHDIRQSTPQEQLAFIQYELTKGNFKNAGNDLRNQTTAAGAGSSVSKNYERPRDAAGEASRRGTYAASLSGVPGASAIAANAPQAGTAPGTTVDKSVQVQISQIDVNTKATDAPGIAQDLYRSLDFAFVSQANYGLVP